MERGEVTMSLGPPTPYECPMIISEHVEVIQLSYRENIYSMYQAQEFCDVTLVSGLNNQKISAHRLILSAASSYFSAMFRNEFKEKNQREIILQDVHGVELKLLIDSVYSNKIEINEVNVCDILKAASKLQFNEIESKCSEFIARSINVLNCLTFWVSTEPFDQTIAESAFKYAEVSFSDVVEIHQFLLLDGNHLFTLLKSERLNVWSEEQVFNALVKWLEYDAEARKSEVSKLLTAIRFIQLKAKFLYDKVEGFCQKFGCLDLIKDIYKLKHQLNIQPSLNKPRKSTTVKRLIAIGDFYRGECVLETYCPVSDKWSVFKNLTFLSQYRNYIILNNDLYIFGNRNGAQAFEKLNLLTGKHTELEPMGRKRRYSGLAASDKFIYVAGEDELVDAERFELQTSKWHPLASMNVKRKKLALGVLNDVIFAAGGCDEEDDDLNSVEYYDCIQNRWNFATAMHQGRSGHLVATYKNFLYVVGGCSVNTVEFYDQSTKIWTLIETISISLMYPVGSISGNFLYVSRSFVDSKIRSPIIKIDLNTFSYTYVAGTRLPGAHVSLLEFPLYNPATNEEE